MRIKIVKRFENFIGTLIVDILSISLTSLTDVKFNLIYKSLLSQLLVLGKKIGRVNLRLYVIEDQSNLRRLKNTFKSFSVPTNHGTKFHHQYLSW